MGAFLGLLMGVGLLLIWRSGSRVGDGATPSAPGWVTRRSELLHQAGVDGVGSGQLLGAQVLCALLVSATVLVLTATVAVAGCFAVFAFFAPVLVVHRMRRRRQVALRELWPEAVDNLASAVRAGMSLPEGLAALAERGPSELRAPFARFAVAHRASGRFDACLDALKRDLADPVGDRVCETLRVAREVGGSDLGTVLRTLSELLRSDARTRAELETRQGWVIKAARTRRVVYQYSFKRSQHDNRAIEAMADRAEKVAAGTRPLKRDRFVKIAGADKSVNWDLVDRARQLAGLKGYVTNIPTDTLDGR